MTKGLRIPKSFILQLGGQCLEDILYEAAIKYRELINSEYYIVLGRKNTEHHLHLKFLEESFYHLIGLQHLKDIKFPTTNKARMFREILNKRINLKMIQKSVSVKMEEKSR